jgi:hypothetical protein
MDKAQMKTVKATAKRKMRSNLKAAAKPAVKSGLLKAAGKSVGKGLLKASVAASGPYGRTAMILGTAAGGAIANENKKMKSVKGRPKTKGQMGRKK